MLDSFQCKYLSLTTQMTSNWRQQTYYNPLKTFIPPICTCLKHLYPSVALISVCSIFICLKRLWLFQAPISVYSTCTSSQCLYLLEASIPVYHLYLFVAPIPICHDHTGSQNIISGLKKSPKSLFMTIQEEPQNRSFCNLPASNTRECCFTCLTVPSLLMGKYCYFNYSLRNGCFF